MKLATTYDYCTSVQVFRHHLSMYILLLPGSTGTHPGTASSNDQPLISVHCVNADLTGTMMDAICGRSIRTSSVSAPSPAEPGTEGGMLEIPSADGPPSFRDPAGQFSIMVRT